jgi:hypothetical protein
MEMDEQQQEVLRLTAAEDQWRPRWGPGSKAPKDPRVPDLRGMAKEIDDVLLRAARILSFAPIASPATVQLLKNAICMHDANMAYLRGEMDEATHTELVHMLYGPGTYWHERTRRLLAQSEPDLLDPDESE